MEIKTTEKLSLLKAVNPWHIATAILLACLILFLSFRASDEYRWSDWSMADAQAILTLRHWEEGGWLNNYFLFIPQGYAKVVRLFDEPGLRHHAHGISPYSSTGVGPRLWYTHYPSGFLIPYAVLFRLGLDDIFYARMLSIVYSIVALILMYMVFSRITGTAVAFVAVFFYGLSPAFLGYADSLVNQPTDDLLRFGFMLAVVLSTRAVSLKHRKVWMFSAWGIEFLLSLSSFDSVFFVYLWLIGWDILERRDFRWKAYLIYALAPVIAHSMQFLQNVWYLGLDDAVRDIKDIFLQKSTVQQAVQGYGAFSGNRFDLTLLSLKTLFNNLYKPLSLIVIMQISYIVYKKFLMDKNTEGLPAIRLLTLLFVCGLAYVVILPHGAMMSYQGRQMAPFTALLAGGYTWSFVKVIKQDGPWLKEFSASGKLALAHLVISALVLIVFWYRFALIDRKPLCLVPKQNSNIASAQSDNVQRNDLLSGERYLLKNDMLFAKALKSMRTSHEPVFFDLGGFHFFMHRNYVPGYPQINPMMEYYAGSRPILCFTSPEGVAKDILFLIRKSWCRFSPVLITSDARYIGYIVSILRSNGRLERKDIKVHPVMGRYVFDLTGYLNWDAGETDKSP